MGDRSGSTPEVDGVPSAIVEEVHSRWNTLLVHREPFAVYARERQIDLATLPKEFGADLYLAFACFSRVSGAVEAFYQSHGARIRAVGRRFEESEDFADELLQKVSEGLFVTSAGIGQYRAEAPLSAWVSTVARRVALRQVKAARPERVVDDDALAAEISEACDQELFLLQARHRELVRAAMISALRQMPKREQRFLQLNLIAGVSMARIGKIYGISQSSVSRKIQRAIHNVITEAKRLVRLQVGVSSTELESIFRLIQSCIDLTLTPFTEPPPAVVGGGDEGDKDLSAEFAPHELRQ
jgi:RNA polymerase sigma-70 factor